MYRIPLIKKHVTLSECEGSLPLLARRARPEGPRSRERREATLPDSELAWHQAAHRAEWDSTPWTVHWASAKNSRSCDRYSPPARSTLNGAQRLPFPLLPSIVGCQESSTTNQQERGNGG
jgi:hypothetical protein